MSEQYERAPMYDEGERRIRDWWFDSAGAFWKGLALAGHLGLLIVVGMALAKYFDVGKSEVEVRAIEDAKIEWCIVKWKGEAHVTRWQYFGGCTVPARY